MKEKED